VGPEVRYVLDARTAADRFPGIGRYAYNLARAMVPLLGGGESLVLLRDPSAPSGWDLTPVAGGKATICDLPASPFSVSQQWRVRRALRRLGANLYHSAYYLMPYRPGVPTVLTVYDLIPVLFPQHVSIQASLLFRWAMALALRASGHVIAISEAALKDYQQLYRVAPEKVAAIPLAADPVFCPRPPAEVASVRRKHGLPESYVLYLGSNKPHKNLVRLVDAWAQIQPQPVPLVIAGAWDSRYPRVRQRVRELGLDDVVLWQGSVAEPDLPALYAGATLFVFPSLYEGFGLPVLEAMACGTPVAAADSSSIPEVGGDAALYFDPIDIDEMAETIRSLLYDDELQERFRALGLAQAASYSWDRTARRTLEIYRRGASL
jgi:glycosyltransferase involved in cell wall biosynthesis